MTIENIPDKRQFHRIFYHALATISNKDSIYPCEIIDLSLKGCLVKFKEPWTEDPETLVTLNLQLSDEISIKMELSSVHTLNHEVGFRCVHIDIDSISQLRRLVELNLGDSDVLERDLQSLSAKVV